MAAEGDRTLVTSFPLLQTTGSAEEEAEAAGGAHEPTSTSVFPSEPSGSDSEQSAGGFSLDDLCGTEAGDGDPPSLPDVAADQPQSEMDAGTPSDAGADSTEDQGDDDQA